MATKSKQTLSFSHLYLENWRNFTRVDASLQRRVFIVGPNASGKSNLLDALHFLSDIVSFGGGFEEAVARRGGVSKIRCLAARRYPEIIVHVHVSNGEKVPLWEYELHIAQDNMARPIIKKERVVRNGRQLLSRPLQDDKDDPEQLRQTYIEQLRANAKFRDLAKFFASIKYLHVVPQLIKDPDKYRGQSNDPYGWDFLQRVSNTPQRTRDAWLRRIQTVLKVAVPQLQKLELYKDKSGRPHLRGKYEHWRAKGAWQTEEAFSDGTLRLMGLLWAILDGSGPLLLEEPEMSLHPEVVRFIPQMLARMQRRTGRQVILSTHSSDLLRDEGIGLDEVLFLKPTGEGTEVWAASNIEEISALLESGANLADVVMPKTKPKNAHQLSLFGD